MSEHDHHHDGHHHHGSALSDVELRVRALETVLTEKGYVDPAALDRIVEAYETRVGPHIGAAAVALAWVDPVFRAALLAGRYWIELLAPDAYLASPYYERWLARLENLLLARDLVGKAELAAGHADGPGRPVKGRALTQADIGGVLIPGSFGRPVPAPARFKVGDRVRARNIHPRTHTRLPRYVRGHVGLIERLHGCHVFPDAIVAAGAEAPQFLYTVTFEGATLWGPDSEPGLRISVDAFEPYLDAA